MAAAGRGSGRKGGAGTGASTGVRAVAAARSGIG